MRYSYVFSAVAAFAVVGAQDIDFAGVDATPDPVINIIPGLKEQAVPFEVTEAIADVVSEVVADPLDVKPVSEPSAVPEIKKHLRRGACDPEPSNPNTYGFDLSSASKFRADSKIASVAKGASTPSGYFNTFTNLQGASSAYGYLGYKVVETYDPSHCASECNSKDGCLGFNIYVERDPSANPGPECRDPEAVANIKCSFWGGPVYTDTANNNGQWREQFEVAIAGSNGYSSLTTQSAEGYKQVELKNNAINSPLDCNKQGSYMGYKLFVQPAFDAKLCAAACKEQNKWATEHPPADGKPQLCRYFNTYILLKNGVSQGQYCSMYTQEWDASFATNDGQYRGDDHYTIQYSFGFTDESDDGVPVCPSDISYLKSSGDEFCSSYIGYSQPTTTATATATITPAPQTATITRTVTSTSTSGIAIVTAAKFNGRHARRADNSTEVTNDVVVDPYEIAIVAVKTLSHEDDPSISKLNDTMAAELNRAVEKRDLVTPASIAAWPTSKISAACSQVATGTVTTTQTITTTAATFFATETKDFQTVVVVQSTCNVPAPRPTAPSYTRIAGGDPSEGVPMVPGPADRPYFNEYFTLNLPFAVKIFQTSSTQIGITTGGVITVGDYVFNAFAEQFYIYGGWRHGMFYRVDGDIGARKIHFSWFAGTIMWGHERFHVTAMFDEAKPGVLTTKVFDTVGQIDNRRTISVEGAGKNVVFAQWGSTNVHEGQEITFDTTSAGSVSAKDFDRIDCCTKTGWEWHVCSEV
ncbi:uncharacterized protein J4E92_008284 [Alternaria infectoria]|uniref:uncharacterized protein n=1 Tax=Alternaria infectoria TaxID=45303 RepID=UPI00221E4746|nr:uncharacterized protein J4E92_008284 [Alternaria infectoria]KAI4920641.1 hypothetical protein J4E92_008284 [Alternaria infectoria]